MVHIRKKNSIHVATGDAFGPLNGPGTLIVDKDAFLITDANGAGARLAGDWTVVINGNVSSFSDSNTDPGLEIGPMLLGTSMNVKIGATGLVRGGKIALDASEAGTITNSGRIIGAFVAVQADTDNGNVTLTNKGKIKGGSGTAVAASGDGEFTLKNGGLIANPGSAFEMAQTGLGQARVTNWGTLDGVVILGHNSDEFTNFKKVGHKVISGTVTGVIDLRDGNDIFHGGSKKEIVAGGNDVDTVTLGKGNDQFRAFHNDGEDSVNGGAGTDTYDIQATETDVIFLVNLDTENHQGVDPFQVADILLFVSSEVDEVLGFENVLGGLGRDDIYGSSGTNVIKGRSGEDNLHGLGGRDILEGGADADTFWFHALSDSRVAAAKRDLILDFATGQDKIDLSEIDANTKLANDQAFHLTANGGQHKFTHDPGELRIEKPKGLTIVSGDVNGDGKADFSFALKGHVALVDTDFVL